MITHSQAGPLGFLMADSRPSLVKTLVSLEPQGPPFQQRVISNSTAVTLPWGLTNIPITYESVVDNPAVDLPTIDIPPRSSGLTDCILQASPPHRLPNLSQVPMLVVTSEASFHAGYDYCTVEYLRQGGVHAHYMNLSAEGVHGNAHFFFMEKNNLKIASKVEH